MKRILAVALFSLSSSAFSMSQAYLRHEVSELETSISKAESFFGEGCKEATDGYNSCIKRLAGVDITRLAPLKKELASKIKAEKVATSTSEKKGCSNFFRVGQSAKTFVIECMKVDGLAVRVPESKRSYYSSSGLTEVYVYGKTTFYFKDGILDYIIN